MLGRKKIIIGNWKMNPETQGEAKRIFINIKDEAAKRRRVLTVICPPAIYLNSLRKLYTTPKMALGAQTISEYSRVGAWTGEISAELAHGMGASFSIVGHSERRELGEDNGAVARKARAVLEAGLFAVVCVGEKERNESGSFLRFIENQLKLSLAKTPKKYLRRLIVAYEPLWAISKGFKNKVAMKPCDVEETILFIKKILIVIYGKEEGSLVPILYGGSAAPESASDLMSIPALGGLLVGRDSLDPERFGKILKIADGIRI